MIAPQVQLDLFGEVEEAERKAEQEAAERVEARAAWQARFERADWVAPWPTADGRPAGHRQLGYRCPDPECGEIEPNSFHLSISHGWDPEVPGHEPFDGRCIRVRLLAAHRSASGDASG